MSNEYIDLSCFDQDYIASPEQTGSIPIPDGEYDVIVDRAEIGLSKANEPMLKMQLSVINNQQFGKRKLFKNTVIATKNFGWIKHDLKLMGMQIEKISTLQSRLAELLDITLRVKKVTKGEYENIYILSKINSQSNNNDLPF